MELSMVIPRLYVLPFFMSFDALFIFQIVFKSKFFASSGFFDDLIILITLSIFSTLTDNPNKM